MGAATTLRPRELLEAPLTAGAPLHKIANPLRLGGVRLLGALKLLTRLKLDNLGSQTDE